MIYNLQRLGVRKRHAPSLSQGIFENGFCTYTTNGHVLVKGRTLEEAFFAKLFRKVSILSFAKNLPVFQTRSYIQQIYILRWGTTACGKKEKLLNYLSIAFLICGISHFPPFVSYRAVFTYEVNVRAHMRVPFDFLMGRGGLGKRILFGWDIFVVGDGRLTVPCIVSIAGPDRNNDSIRI